MNKNNAWIIAVVIIAFCVVSCMYILGSFSKESAVCGNGICEPPETCNSCPQDCGSCLTAKECPISCDDNNPCTRDYCSAATNYECKHEPIVPCCGNGVCEMGESCETCEKDCGKCRQLHTISYSDVNSMITVSEFRYIPIDCGGGICREGTGSAIFGSEDEGFWKMFSFKIYYTPLSRRDLYFQAYSIKPSGEYATSTSFKLLPGENIVYMSAKTEELYDDLNIKLCFSYVDFVITADGKFLKESNMERLDESEYVCINKVFKAPKIDVEVTPSILHFSFNKEKRWGKNIITVRNTGDVPVFFYFWAPNIHDGTGRTSEQPDCSWDEYYFVLRPNENKEIELTCGIYSSEFPLQNYFTETGYIYAFPSEKCGTSSMPLIEAGCPKSAIFKKSFTLDFDIS